MPEALLDAISYPYTDETRRRLLFFFDQKKTLLDVDLLSEHLINQPVLGAVLIIFAFLSIVSLVFVVVFLGCRALGKCGAKRYQAHPTSNRRYGIYVSIFLVSWVLFAASSAYFFLSGLELWQQKSQNVILNQEMASMVTQSMQLDHKISKRSAFKQQNVFDLFDNADYQGDFEQMDDTPTMIPPALLPSTPHVHKIFRDSGASNRHILLSDTSSSTFEEEEEEAPPAVEHLPIRKISPNTSMMSSSKFSPKIEIPARPTAEIEFRKLMDGQPIRTPFVGDNLPSHRLPMSSLNKITSTSDPLIDDVTGLPSIGREPFVQQVHAEYDDDDDVIDDEDLKAFSDVTAIDDSDLTTPPSNDDPHDDVMKSPQPAVEVEQAEVESERPEVESEQPEVTSPVDDVSGSEEIVTLSTTIFNIHQNDDDDLLVTSTMASVEMEVLPEVTSDESTVTSSEDVDVMSVQPKQVVTSTEEPLTSEEVSVTSPEVGTSAEVTTPEVVTTSEVVTTTEVTTSEVVTSAAMVTSPEVTTLEVVTSPEAPMTSSTTETTTTEEPEVEMTVEPTTTTTTTTTTTEKPLHATFLSPQNTTTTKSPEEGHDDVIMPQQTTPSEEFHTEKVTTEPKRPTTVNLFPDTPIDEEDKRGTVELLASASLYPYLSLHSTGLLLLHKISFSIISLLVVIVLLPSLFLVLTGSVCYLRSYHPMDRTKTSEKIGQLTVILSILLLFTLPLLFVYVGIVFFYDHLHTSICPDVQLQYQQGLGLLEKPSSLTSPDFFRSTRNKANCQRYESPIQGLWISVLILTFSSIVLVFSLFKLSKYYLRMKTEYYWTLADYGTIYTKRAVHADAVYGNIYGTIRAKRPSVKPPPTPFGVENHMYGEQFRDSPVYGTYSAYGRI